MAALDSMSMFCKDFCVDVDIAVFKVEVVIFKKLAVLLQFQQLIQNLIEKPD